jgi:hypothetical protein
MNGDGPARTDDPDAFAGAGLDEADLDVAPPARGRPRAPRVMSPAAFPPEALQFLAALFPPDVLGADRTVNFRGLHHGASTADAEQVFAPSLAKLDTNGTGRRLLQWAAGGRSVYVAPGVRRDRDGTKAGVVALPALWIDLDAKLLLDKDALTRVERELGTEQAQARLTERLPAALAPSIILDTGGGLHAWWLLREPAAVGDDARDAYPVPLLEASLKGLAQHLGADPFPTQIAALMRLPGFVNAKYPDRPRVRVLTLDAGRRFNVSDFAEYRTLGAEAAHAPAPPVEDVIPEGARNATLASLAGTMRRRGMQAAEIEAALLVVNRDRCRPPLAEPEVRGIVASVARYEPAPEPEAPADAAAADAPDAGAWAVGAGAFLRQTHPPVETLIDPLLSSEGGGFLGGEEKLGKTYYALDEGLCLALALPVCGRFAVATPHRVLFIEEEDSPRRTQTRLRALLRGHGLDPDDRAVQARLDERFRLACWTGFTFDAPAWIERLRAEIAAHRPHVLYVDALRKVTLRDLNKADLASQILALLDGLRRHFDVLTRLVHHYRKGQGFGRSGRGSQELGGSYVLGAWAENSLYFEPVGRKGQGVTVTLQSKDAAPVAAWALRIEAEGPRHAPTEVRLHADYLASTASTADAATDEAIYEAVAALPPKAATKGAPGVPREDVEQATGKSSATVRRGLDRLQDAGRILLTGTMSKGKKLYAISLKEST